MNPARPAKERLDKILVDRGLAPTRERAKALIMANAVTVNATVANKSGMTVPVDAVVEVKQPEVCYVSRGGLKLEKALRAFEIEVQEKTAVDIGASTGGFTDCLLQNGARRVYAVDVGYGQLAWTLRQDKRVIILERRNIRFLKPEDIGEEADIAVIDVSFISLTLVLPVVKDLIKDQGEIVALVKPQFEAGRGQVGKGGIVRDPELQKAACGKIESFSREIGLEPSGLIESPILGTKGNKEFLLYLKKGGPPPSS